MNEQQNKNERTPDTTVGAPQARLTNLGQDGTDADGRPTSSVLITPIRPQPLPDRVDKAMIDAWFTENYAKHTGMRLGFGSQFIALEGSVLRFVYIVDPRYLGHALKTCSHIAARYVHSIPVLGGATHFEAAEFRATDLLGFVDAKDFPGSTYEELAARTKHAWATMPSQPNCFHEGPIPPPGKEDSA